MAKASSAMRRLSAVALSQAFSAASRSSGRRKLEGSIFSAV
jgi:hypothetical protein